MASCWSLMFYHDTLNTRFSEPYTPARGGRYRRSFNKNKPSRCCLPAWLSKIDLLRRGFKSVTPESEGVTPEEIFDSWSAQAWDVLTVNTDLGWRFSQFASGTELHWPDRVASQIALKSILAS